MKNFQKIPPTERGLFIAKLYHNIWYDTNRFTILSNLLDEWETNPIKEAKYLLEIHSDIKESDIKF
jgi:hypothetical protein